jgi:hypothetical protein
VKVKRRLNVVAVGKAAQALGFCQGLARAVPPLSLIDACQDLLSEATDGLLLAVIGQKV